MTLLLAAIVGAAWRRWFGAARPEWAFTGYRAIQIVAGMGVLSLIAGPSWASLACAAAAVGFCTLPIAISRGPFEWLAARLPLPTTDGLDHPWKPMLQGQAPWAEVFQGAAVFSLAMLVSFVMGQ